MSAAEYQRKHGGGTKGQGKYNAKRVEIDGIRFDSKLEGDYYLFLKQLVAAGEIAYFLRQVPFHLPGGVRYVVDFMVVRLSPSPGADPSPVRIRYVDVKGVETAMFKTKKRMVESLYPIKIEVIKRGEFR